SITNYIVIAYGTKFNLDLGHFYALIDHISVCPHHSTVAQHFGFTFVQAKERRVDYKYTLQIKFDLIYQEEEIKRNEFFQRPAALTYLQKEFIFSPLNIQEVFQFSIVH
ncbi:hypothetical protein ACJX0J_033112, partial [Zea mays]